VAKLLCNAGRLGREEILVRLLGRDDVEPDRVNNAGLIPLAGIVWGGYVEPTKTQLGCPDVDLNLGDRDACSLLALVPVAVGVF